MKENKIRIISIFVILFVIFAGGCVNAHQGKTDSSGGHRDNKIKVDWEVIITTVVAIQRICIQMERVHIQPKHHQNQNLQIKVQIQTSQKTIIQKQSIQQIQL